MAIKTYKLFVYVRHSPFAVRRRRNDHGQDARATHSPYTAYIPLEKPGRRVVVGGYNGQWPSAHFLQAQRRKKNHDKVRGSPRAKPSKQPALETTSKSLACSSAINLLNTALEYPMRILFCLLFVAVLHAADGGVPYNPDGPNIGIVGKAPITYYHNNVKVSTDKICFYPNDTMNLEGAAGTFDFKPEAFKLIEKAKNIYLVSVTFSNDKEDILKIELQINTQAEIIGKQTYIKPGEKPLVYTFKGKITERLND